MKEIKLKLIAERMIFPKAEDIDPENGYYIFSCTSDSEEVEKHPLYRNFKIKGDMQRLEIGTEYVATIKEIERHPQYGVTYEVSKGIYQELPTSGYKQRDFFRAILTENQFKSLYDAYGYEVDLIDKFKNDEIDVTRVKGLGEESYKKVKDKIMKNLDYQQLISELSKYGVSFNVIIKLVEQFGSADLAIKTVRNNPYSLTKINGIGFSKADAIAKNMKKEEIEIKLNQGEINKDEANLLFVEKVFKSPFRIRCGIKHVLTENQSNGHSFIFVEELIRSAKELLQVADELIENEILELHKLNEIYFDENRAALKGTYETEQYIANWIAHKNANSEILEFDVEDFILKMEDKYQITLTDQQKSFFYNVKNHSVHLLIGFAGCGKSMLQKLLKDLLQELGKTVKWLAPTGNASKILSNYVDDIAVTVHRAIGYGSRNDNATSTKDIDADYIVIDETSMLDIFIDKMLLSRITNPKARVLFIGDAFQIPSVSTGNLLHDMIESGVIPTTMLNTVFRQKDGGALDVATKIRLGEKFIENQATGEYRFGNDFVIACVDQDSMIDAYEHYYEKLLSKYSPENIMVLSVKKSGDLGTVAINKNIQAFVNPASGFKKEIPFGDENVLREKDYVINTKNTYNIENIDGIEVDVVNGDKGIITKIITKEDNKLAKTKVDLLFDDDTKLKNPNGVYIEFDDDQVKFDNRDIGQLLHAWCLTMHKSQGGSADAVIVIADRSHLWNLNANLLYTAITRLKIEGVMLCQPDVINKAMKKVINLTRNTFLQELLVLENEIIKDKL